MELIEVSKAYRCPWCRKLYTQRPAADGHRTHCMRNPQRTPRDGEITKAKDWDCFPNQVTGEIEVHQAWHPGKPGMVYIDGAWRPVPEYKHQYYSLADAFLSWDGGPDDGYKEEWPTAEPLDPDCTVLDMNDGREFDRCSKRERVELMRAYDAQQEIQNG